MTDDVCATAGQCMTGAVDAAAAQMCLGIAAPDAVCDTVARETCRASLPPKGDCPTTYDYESAKCDVASECGSKATLASCEQGSSGSCNVTESCQAIPPAG